MKRKLMLLLACLFVGISLVTAQTQKVTGVVISEEDGQPVVGASVLVKGTTQGTITDIDGNFNLANVPSSAKTLQISYIGMQTQEVAIKPMVKVTLKSDAQNLDEVIVVAYGTAKKSSFTGSAAVIKADKIVSGSKESFDKALSGKMAGVRTASATGDPGSMAEINIRGVGSISASKSPLYVIDGVVTKADDDMNYYGKTQSVLSTLNPEDIESMTVLKDAAAASLYGSRAANGVIIITTKKGKEGKTNVSYSGEVGWNKMAVNAFNMMGSADLIDYTRESLANCLVTYGITDSKQAALNNIDNGGDMFIPLLDSPATVADFIHDPSGKVNTNWKKEIYRTAFTQDHQISINGGSSKTQFYAGVGYNKSEGIVLGSDFERISGRLNVNHKVNNWLNVALKQMIAATSQDGFRDQGDQAQGMGTSSPIGILFAMDPTAPVKNEDGSYNKNAAWGKVTNPHLMLGGKDSDTALEWIQTKMFRSMTNADVTIKFCDKLSLNSIFGYDYVDNKHFEYWDRNSVNGGSVSGMGSRYTFESRVATSSSTLNYVALKQMIAATSQDGFRDQGDQAQGMGTSSPIGILFAMDPTAPVKNEDGSYNKNAAWGKVTNPHLMLGGKDSDTALEWIQTKMFRSMTNADVTIKFCDKLSLNSIFGYDYVDNKHFEYWDRNSVNGGSVSGMGSRYTFESRVATSSSTLNYTDTFKDMHNLNLMAGFEVENRDLLQIVTVAKRYSSHYPELANGQPDQAASSTLGAGMMSYFASGNYNYDNKYYLSASFRRDGSSRLSEDNRWASFWSVSGAWRMSKEGFMQDMPLFTDFKIKASYGTNGNLPSDYYGYMDLYTGSGYGSAPAIYWSRMANDKLSWEKSKNFNMGIEWNMYDRVNLSLEYYNKKTTDLLFEVPTSLITGFDSRWENLGALKNDGFELELNSKNISNKNFTWTSNFNLTYQRALVDKLPEGKDIQYGDGEMYLHREGESMYTFYLPEWKGVNPETGLGEFWLDPEDHSKGVVNDYSEAGKGIVGKALPDVIGGFSNTFTYKDFDLSFLITYQFGGDMFDYPGYFSHHDGVRIGSMNLSEDVAGNYWKNPGDKVDNPMPIYANPYRWDRFSSRTIKSTDNIRLREMTVGYTLPVLKKHISNFRIYFRANNLAMLWSKTKNIDPDVAINGYRQADTPALRSCVFGINIKL